MYQSENYGFDRDEVEIGLTDDCTELRYITTFWFYLHSKVKIHKMTYFLHCYIYLTIHVPLTAKHI